MAACVAPLPPPLYGSPVFQVYAENLLRRFPEILFSLGAPNIEEAFEPREAGRWRHTILETPSEKVIEVVLPRKQPFSGDFPVKQLEEEDEDDEEFEEYYEDDEDFEVEDSEAEQEDDAQARSFAASKGSSPKGDADSCPLQVSESELDAEGTQEELEDGKRLQQVAGVDAGRDTGRCLQMAPVQAQYHPGLGPQGRQQASTMDRILQHQQYQQQAWTDNDNPVTDNTPGSSAPSTLAGRRGISVTPLKTRPPWKESSEVRRLPHLDRVGSGGPTTDGNTLSSESVSQQSRSPEEEHEQEVQHYIRQGRHFSPSSGSFDTSPGAGIQRLAAQRRQQAELMQALPHIMSPATSSFTSGEESPGAQIERLSRRRCQGQRCGDTTASTACSAPSPARPAL